MPYYNICELCGGTLDPGERCDCQERAKELQKEQQLKKSASFVSQLLNNERKRRKRKK